MNKIFQFFRQFILLLSRSTLSPPSVQGHMMEYPQENTQSDVTVLPKTATKRLPMNTENLIEPKISSALDTDEQATCQAYVEKGQGQFFRYIKWGYAGSTDHNYEDAAAANPDTGIAAIADGTTLGWRSDVVSTNLVSYYVKERFRLDQEKERKLWWDLTYRQWYFERKEHYNAATSSEQQKIERGGSSTFLGLRMDDLYSYRLYSIGDCSLLWFHHGKLVEVEGATQFDTHPQVLTTNDLDASQLLKIDNERSLPGEWALFATDALAKFLLDDKPWETTDGDYCSSLEDKFTGNGFGRFMEHYKSREKLDSDDYTLLLLHFSAIATSEEASPTRSLATPLEMIAQVNKNESEAMLLEADTIDQSIGIDPRNIGSADATGFVPTTPDKFYRQNSMSVGNTNKGLDKMDQGR